MDTVRQRDLTHELFLPVLLFAALGAMAWAVRGSAGAGGMNAHVAPGLIWGTAWWFLARDRGGPQSRRYSSGWIILAVTAGFAIAGERGWMQWHHFYDGHLSTNYAKQEYVPISRTYGFLWYFIAGSAWAGLPACFLAWCATQRPMRASTWTLRIACGFGGGYLAWRCFTAYPQVFLPLYDVIPDKYHDFHANPSLIKLYRDCGSATRHVGFCLGFLAFEIARRDWKNVKLILTVGLTTGAGWALLQNWKWAASVWPGASFNFGRCWEVSGGAFIGLGFGIAYYLVNARMQPGKTAEEEARRVDAEPPVLWLLAACLLWLIGWTLFWPPAVDLRQSAAAPEARWLVHMGGYFCLLSGAAFAAAAVTYAKNKASSPDAVGNRARLQAWVNVGLILILGWFIRMQLTNTYSDEPADGAMGGWFGPANIYYAVLAIYAMATALSLKGRNSGPIFGGAPENEYCSRLDGFTIYASLGLILLWCISVGMASSWHASIFFGIAGCAFGVCYYFVGTRDDGAANAAQPGVVPSTPDPNLERWGAYLGLVYGLGLSLRKGIKGGANLYLGNENYWDHIAWNWVALAMLVCMFGGMAWILKRRLPRNFEGDVFPHACGMLWLMLISENVLAQVVTGPMVGSASAWIEFVFNVLYLILFLLTAVVVFHYQHIKVSDSCGTKPFTNGLNC